MLLHPSRILTSSAVPAIWCLAGTKWILQVYFFGPIFVRPGMKPTKIWSLLEGNDNQQQYSRVMCCYTLATFMSLVPCLIHLWLTPVTPFPSANTTRVSLQFSAHRSKLELVLMVQNLKVSLATVQLVQSCFKSSDNPGDINNLGPKTFEFCWLSFTLRRGCARTQLGPSVLTCVHQGSREHLLPSADQA